MVTATFVRRMNHDSTTTSLCTCCSKAIAKSMWESELDKAEKSHECDKVDLQETYYADSQRGTF
jgi:hypothetical protein